MSMDLKGKVALVTGAARGIGRAIACKLAAAGAHVVVADRGADADPALSYPLATPAALAETARLVESEGVRALPLNADVTSAVEVRGMVERAAAQLGGIDILVNNAGVVAAGPLASITEEVWDRVMDVNVKGVFLCTQAVIPLMAERGEGRIVNIASVAGKTGRAGVGVYCASKFAVIGLTQALAEEVGPFNITVNAICPGYLRTAMWTDVLNKFLAAQYVPAPRADARGHRRRRGVPLPRAEHHGHRPQRRGRGRGPLRGGGAGTAQPLRRP
jgi:meso-butanediol dehydrogenase/(S,S)-butanediol dehydrogenase/diacetyl reductase